MNLHHKSAPEILHNAHRKRDMRGRANDCNTVPIKRQGKKILGLLLALWVVHGSDAKYTL